MIDAVHKHERPTCGFAGGAFLRSEAWQSGLLHRAYPSADVWVGNPVQRGHRFQRKADSNPVIADSR
jgi:hypothetical protein